MVCILQGENVLPTLSQVLPPLDESSAQPLYQQLQRALRGAIENGSIGPDDALPPERDLAEMLGVRRTSVTDVASHIQKLGPITYTRGIIRIVDRQALENLSCECYQALQGQ